VYFGYDANQNLARVVVSTPVPADRSKKVLAAWEYVYDTTSDPASANYNNLLYVVGPEGWRKLIADGKASAAALDLTGKTGYADTVSHPADVTWSDYAEEAFYYGTGDAADRVEKYVGGGCSGCGSGTGGHLYRYSAYHGASFAGKNKNGGTSAAYKYSSAYGELPTVTAWDSATCEYVEMDAFGRTVYRSTFVKDGGSMIECDMTKYVYDSRGRLEQTIHNPGVTGKEYTEVTVYDEGKDRSHTSQLVSGGTTRNLAYYEYDDSPTSKSYGKLLRVKRHARADAEADADDRETEYEYYGSGVAAAGQLKYVTYPKDYKGDGDAWTGGGTSTYLQRRTYYTYYDDWDTERNKVYYLKVKDVTEQYMTGGDWQDFTTTRYEYYDGTDLVNGFNGKVKKVTRDWTLNGQGGLNVVTQYLYDDYGDTKRIVEDAGGENLATDTSWTAADDPADTAHETGKHQLRAVTQRLGKLAGGPTGSMDANNQRVVERWRTPGGGTVQLLERARIGSSAEQSTGRTDYQLDAMGEVVRATRYFEAGDTDAVRFDELVFHDNLGRLYRQVDGDDGYTETKYNARRLVEQRAWGSHSVSGGQDVFSESGVTAKYAYHGTVPWLDSVEDGGARERTEYHYDTWGRVSYVQRRRWDEAAQDPAWQTLSTVGYAYNNFDEVVETKAWNQGVNPGNNPPTPASWSRTDYTADGRVFRQATLDAVSSDTRVVVENHSYYSDGRQVVESRTIATTHGDAITTDEFNAGPRTLSAFDKLGRQASITDAKENKVDFTLDKLGQTTKQVTTEQKPGGGTKTSYLYSWYDYLGRTTTTADYGVSASDPAPSSAPADAGAACLVTKYAYGWGSDGVPGGATDREFVEIVTKNRNVESEPATRSYRDWLGRTVVVWENY
ncbi:MAG TPA: hypothetical protein PKZ08_13145, partial [Vicinamibacterales bacterium]|nr:hypothetical protein [Vicinamibacterales bacterium]